MHLSNPGYLFSLSVVDGVFLAWLIVYASLMIILYRQYRRFNFKPLLTPRSIKVALIIPFRNEASNILKLAGQLRDSVPSSWEIIWVDDHSEDSSLQMILRWIKANGFEGWQVLAANGMGKKRALQTGILFSSADIIVTTDADVGLDQNAFRELIQPFSDSDVKLVAGPVISQADNGLFACFQQIEWASILLVTGAFFQVGKPLMCSGANLAFRKKAFLDVDGYQGNEHVMSGDDEFLLKKIVKKYGPSSTVFLATKKALIFVPPADSVGEFLQQRMRWGSKWKSHGSLLHSASALFAALFTMFPIVALLFFLIGPLNGWVLAIIWIGRFICDFLVLGRVLSALGVHLRWFYFLVTGVIHPLYVFAISLGIFRGGFIWKGRKSKLFH